MATATLRRYVPVEIIIAVLHGGGVITALFSIVSLVLTTVVVRSPFGISGIALLFCGIGAVAFAQLLLLLTEIAGHLAAIRAQVGKGVFGLLG